MKRTIVIDSIVFLYTALFLYTGISKLIEYDVFKEQLSESPILGPFSSVISIIVLSSEFIIALMLLTPRWRLKGFCAALCLMTVFTIYIVALISISDKLPCSCGGIISQLSWQQHIVFNSAFIGLACLAIILQKKVIKTEQEIISSAIESKHSMIGQKA